MHEAQWLDNQAKKERERASKAEEEVCFTFSPEQHITRCLLSHASLQAREEARIARERLQLQMQYDR